MKRDHPHRRRGSIYVIVVGMAMFVTIIGLSALMLVRIERRVAQDLNDLARAQLHAQSAIEMGLLLVDNDPNWRNTYTSGPWLSNQPIGSGTFSLEGVDPVDGDLADDRLDSLSLIGTGLQGTARHKSSLTLTVQTVPLTCLNVALHAGNKAAFTNAVVQCDQTISSNGDVTITSSVINANVEAVGSISGSANGTTTNGVEPRAMPDANVFNYYVANGTPISYAALPGGQISGTLLSPAYNPFGPTNAEGIYVIDCAGANIRISDARIVGTLVLLNPGGISTVEKAIHWEPAVANYPSLLVDGNMGFNMSPGPLSEGTVGLNLNPPGTPYSGVSDSDLSGTYPSIIKGLVYVSGNCTSTYEMSVDGVVVVGGNAAVADTLNLTYQPTFLDNPPPGFVGPAGLTAVPGSWRQVVE